MTKERINVTVDKSVKRELDARNDINTSGLVNDFLVRWLRGESDDEAAERLRAERIEAEADKLIEQAESKRRQADTIREQLQEKRQRREDRWEDALRILGPDDESPLKSTTGDIKPDPPDPRARSTQFWADKLGLSPHEFSERFIEKWEQRHDAADDTGMYQ